ncbi:BON domain-containing protein [Methyloversatilis thermotolerans]|uniref:BON domain-containing protein n=1 Tax=Methyloversatilis thermotolerans TaxID=1346290 RepID=UPI00035E7EFC|nr:BON domain-containing protein [Methyloversatilis thermotolerans]
MNRHIILGFISTTAMAYSICTPAQAAELVAESIVQIADGHADERDRRLQERVKGALHAEASLDGCYVAVAAHDGRVSLAGVVRDATQLARVLQTIVAIPGVREVDNGLEVVAGMAAGGR